MKLTEVHIKDLKVGDTAIRPSDDALVTINKDNLKYSSFMGLSLWGDSFRLGTIKIKRVRQ